VHVKNNNVKISINNTQHPKFKVK